MTTITQHGKWRVVARQQHPWWAFWRVCRIVDHPVEMSEGCADLECGGQRVGFTCDCIEEAHPHVDPSPEDCPYTYIPKWFLAGLLSEDGRDGYRPPGERFA